MAAYDLRSQPFQPSSQSTSWVVRLSNSICAFYVDHMPPTTEDGELKTVSVDLNLFGMSGSTKSSKPRTRPATRRPTQSDEPTAKDIASKSAALQAAVEEALASASTPRAVPRTQQSDTIQPKHPQLHTTPPPLANSGSASDSDVKVVVSDLAPGAQNQDAISSKENETASSKEGEGGIGGALKQLNELMARRVQRRLMKTQKAKMAKAIENPKISMPSAVEGTGQARDSPSAEAGVDAPSLERVPRWGNLKGGNLPTYRKYSKTLKASRAERHPAEEPKVSPAVSFTDTSTQDASAQNEKANVVVLHEDELKPVKKTSIVKSAIKYNVGKQKGGKIGLILNPESLNKTRRATKTKDKKESQSRHSVTARNRMRKAGLLTGGTNVPQRLIDTMSAAVEKIGSVERTS